MPIMHLLLSRITPSRRPAIVRLVLCNTALAMASFPLAPRLFAQAAPTDETPKHESESPAATEANQSNGDETIKMNELVVSGTVAPRRKLESAAAVTTIDFDQIKITAPRGGPDLMKLVPGIYVESAGGEGRANVYTRGIPQAGGYTFAGLQEDGLGVLSETATLTYTVTVNADAFSNLFS